MKRKSNNLKNVLLVGWFFYPKVGGVESLMLNQAKYLIKRGFNVTVLTFLNGELKSEENHLGIKIIRKEFMDTKKRYPLDKLQTELEQIIDKTNPCIVHFHNGSYPAGTADRSIGVEKNIIFFNLLKKKNIYVIDHAHNAQLVDSEITKPLRDLSWDKLICVSSFVKKSWQKLGTGAKSIEVIYNGIDLEKYHNVKKVSNISKLKSEKEKLIFFPARIVKISTGEFSKQKNFILLIQAAGKLIKNGVNNFKILAIANESSDSKKSQETKIKLEKIFKKHGVDKNIFFIPPISPEKMPSYYSSIDILCVPSINETFGLVYLEAMAMGKIAIASNTGGPKEYIKNGENGYLVDPKNSLSLASILKKIINRKNNINDICNNAKKTAKDFSIDKMMHKIEKIYIQALQKEDNNENSNRCVDLD